VSQASKSSHALPPIDTCHGTHRLYSSKEGSDGIGRKILMSKAIKETDIELEVP
jgi:hypothetical protein